MHLDQSSSNEYNDFDNVQSKNEGPAAWSTNTAEGLNSKTVFATTPQNYPAVGLFAFFQVVLCFDKILIICVALWKDIDPS